MVQPNVTFKAAIGACLRCRQLFLITPDTPTCYLCGRAPDYITYFAPPDPGRVEWGHPDAALPPPEQPAVLIGITCPHCHSNVQLSISDSEISVLQPPVPIADEEPAESAAAPDQPVESDELVPPLAGYGYAPAGADSAPAPPANDRTTVLSP